MNFLSCNIDYTKNKLYPLILNTDNFASEFIVK